LLGLEPIIVVLVFTGILTSNTFNTLYINIFQIKLYKISLMKDIIKINTKAETMGLYKGLIHGEKMHKDSINTLNIHV